jgi:hypothetical protein
MREVTLAARRRARGFVLRCVLIATLAGCAAPAGGPPSAPSANPNGIVAEVASYEIVANRPARVLVALFAADNRWLSFGSVGVSFTYLGEGPGSPSPVAVTGDSTAAFLPIPGSPEGVDRSPTLTLPADGRGVYAAEPVTFPRSGYWQVLVHADLAGDSALDATAAFSVVDRPSVIGVGSPAPRTRNAVIGDPGVSPGSIDSRAAGGAPIPDPELHTISIAQALDAGHPALVVFSTPVYCVSRFCGPVTDLVAELAAKYRDRADFIHVEIYRDFQAGQVNQAALDWLSLANGDLREPWTFLIGADGRIVASWDAVVTRSEIEPLLEALPIK